jgi:hypothetical protein
MHAVLNFRAIILLSATALLPLLCGCAGSARPQRMVPEISRAAEIAPYHVSVKVSGGHETNPMWSSQISNDAFASALETTLDSCGMFKTRSQSRNGDGADYLIEVTLMSVDQPFVGLDMTVDMQSTWRLIRCDTNTTVWKQDVQGTYTAKFGEAVVGVARLRIANEGAARDSIKKGLAALSQASPWRRT